MIYDSISAIYVDLVMVKVSRSNKIIEMRCCVARRYWARREHALPRIRECRGQEPPTESRSRGANHRLHIFYENGARATCIIYNHLIAKRNNRQHTTSHPQTRGDCKQSKRPLDHYSSICSRFIITDTENICVL